MKTKHFLAIVMLFASLTTSSQSLFVRVYDQNNGGNQTYDYYVALIDYSSGSAVTLENYSGTMSIPYSGYSVQFIFTTQFTPDQIDHLRYDCYFQNTTTTKTGHTLTYLFDNEEYYNDIYTSVTVPK